MSKKQISVSKRNSYSKEFRSDAVKMVLEEGLSQREIVARLGVDEMAIGRWTRKVKLESTSIKDQSVRDLLVTNKKLEEENKRLRMEREIPKKAMAYFVPGQN